VIVGSGVVRVFAAALVALLATSATFVTFPTSAGATPGAANAPAGAFSRESRAAPSQREASLDQPPARIGASATTAVAFGVAASQAVWGDDDATWALLARDDVFADALAGTALAHGGPLLFTSSNALAAATRDELDRVLAGRGTVYLLGGEAALSATVEAAVAQRHDVVRLAGASRIDTAVAVAREAVRRDPQPPAVLVARAFGPADDPNGTAAWADAIAGGAAAARLHLPLVLTPTQDLAAVVDQFLDEVAPRTTYVLGGEAALSRTVLNRVPRGQRVSGPSRLETAAAIADALWGLAPDQRRDDARYLVANVFDEAGWVHGLAGATVAAAAGAALVGITDGGATTATLDLIGACGAGSGGSSGDPDPDPDPEPDRPTLTILGDTATISSDVEAALRTHTLDGCTRPTGPAAFRDVDPDGNPGRYDPCQVVHVVANFSDAPPGAEASVRRALQHLRQVTGLQLTWDGQTVERLPNTAAADDRDIGEAGNWAPILVNWPVDWDKAPGVLGTGGSVALQRSRNGQPTGAIQLVTGVVSINRNADTHPVLDALLLHELGHVVGLDHVDDTAQLLHLEGAVAGLRRYQPGDRAGLDRLGAAAGCNAVAG